MRFCKKCGSAYVPNGGKGLVCRRCGHQLKPTLEIIAEYSKVEKRKSGGSDAPVIEGDWTPIRSRKMDIEKLPDKWFASIYRMVWR